MNTALALRRTGRKAPPAGSGIGRLIAYWRKERNKSQLDLALDADVSQRHVSFVESGRSQPSRDMVTALAEALEIPLRERNNLLTAAGFAPLYREGSLSEPFMSQVQKMLERILDKQEPYPAVVMDSRWNILMTNRAAEKFFGMLIDADAVPGPPNVLRLVFDPQGLRPFIANWETAARGLLGRVYRESVCGVIDETTQSLLAELHAAGSIPDGWREPDLRSPQLPYIPLEFVKDDLKMSFFSAITTLGTPQDITAQETRIECFFPSNEETANSAERFLK